MHEFEDSNEGVDDDFEDLTPYVYAAKSEASSGEIADDDDRKEKVTTDDKAKDQEKKKTASLGLDPSWVRKNSEFRKSLPICLSKFYSK